MKPWSDCLLYAFVDTACLNGRDPADLARALCDGGADVIQFRAKNRPEAAVRAVAETLLPVTRRAGVRFVLNDHWNLASELGADVCHLGQEDFFDAGRVHKRDLPPAAGRSSVPELGLSSHAPDQALRAVAAGADYVAVGPVFATRTKPGRPAVTLEYVKWAADNLTVPWFAIGGIDLNNLDAVLEAGARRICVVSAILNQPDVARACGEFKCRLEAAR